MSICVCHLVGPWLPRGRSLVCNSWHHQDWFHIQTILGSKTKTPLYTYWGRSVLIFYLPMTGDPQCQVPVAAPKHSVISSKFWFSPFAWAPRKVGGSWPLCAAGLGPCRSCCRFLMANRSHTVRVVVFMLPLGRCTTGSTIISHGCRPISEVLTVVHITYSLSVVVHFLR